MELLYVDEILKLEVLENIVEMNPASKTCNNYINLLGVHLYPYGSPVKPSRQVQIPR